MSLTWPWALVALLVVPVLLAARWWFDRRRKRTALTVSSLALIRAAVPGRTAWRRRVPVALFLAGLLTLAVSVARPQATVAVPRADTSILLAVDVSGSMCSTDVKPNRLAAAGEAAREFIQRSDGGTRIGLIAFSGTAAVLVAPTTDKDQLIDAVGDLKTALGTAIGQAILTSIDAIAEYNPHVAQTGVELISAVVPAEFEPDTIVVLTDGSNTTGVDPVLAAQEAAARHIRVFTIGFGTTAPGPMVCTAGQVNGGSFSGGPDPGAASAPGPFMEIDEKALTQVAAATGGRYFRAEDAGRLHDVLTGLPREIGLHEQRTETTVWFLLAGTLLVVTGVTLALWWNRPSRSRSQPRPSPARSDAGTRGSSPGPS
ncbi:VWA domain-containing protein [Actinoplanes oblitus]|uniref:VWA domain-containing protein n=1 Tax=Actinoplanes oblitus TaxID=3040509 RepID=A0ABY8W5K1_9ACTN|nr:VWA domain-containing protein [Actinoplanes oblitus]WIM93124.1 VWA domain-containing protein [Actinoplanes oblitus]